MKQQIFIKASEIGDFIYCPCCWWDNFEDLRTTTKEMELGTLEHDRLAKRLLFFEKVKRIAIVLLLIAAILLIGSIYLVYI